MSNVINVWDQTTGQWINVPALSGDPGIHIGTSAPTDPNKKVWIDPSGTANAVSTEDVKYKIYNSVTDLGLTSGSAVIVDVYAAMPKNTVLLCPAEQFASSELPSGFAGTIEIVRSANSYRGWINLYGDIASRGDWRMHMDSGVPTGTWVRVTPKLSSYTIEASSMPSVPANGNNSVTSSVDWPGSNAFICVTYPGSTGLVVVNTFERDGKIRFTLRNVTSSDVTPGMLYFKVIEF